MAAQECGVSPRLVVNVGRNNEHWAGPRVTMTKMSSAGASAQTRTVIGLPKSTTIVTSAKKDSQGRARGQWSGRPLDHHGGHSPRHVLLRLGNWFGVTLHTTISIVAHM